jgi:hypothetical protein
LRQDHTICTAVAPDDVFTARAWPSGQLKTQS